MAKRVDYKFLTINDALKAINVRVNLVAVVVELGFPHKSGGTDYYCTLKIVDQSHPEPGLSVNFFARSVDELPRVASLGDVILLTRFTMSFYKGGVNAVFNKSFSTFALFKGKDGEDFLPYQCSSRRFQMREEDKRFITELRQWFVEYKLKQDSSYNFSSLKDIGDEEQCNLACKILHVYEAAEDRCIIFVWDGTDVPPCMILPKLEDYVSECLPSHIQVSPLPRHTLCTFPTVGSILTVTAAKCSGTRFVQSLKAGQWIKFLNINCQVKLGRWSAHFTPFTKVRHATEEDSLILKIQGIINERLSKPGRMQYWSSFPYSEVTETEHHKAPFVTLYDVVTYSELTAKFRCIVRVVAALPWRVSDLLDARGTYRIRLTLEDATAQIYAFVYADDGDKLFGGRPTKDVLARKWSRLLGLQVSDEGDELAKDFLRDPPWIQCALKSYYVEKSNPWETRCYRVFDTWIRD